MAWQLLAAALPAAAKIAGTALSKPRQEDYSPQTDYMKKYLSYLRGRSSSREVMHQAMQPALRVAGKQGRQMQRQVGYDVAKSGLAGSGIEAQMRLSAGQQTQEALATATDKAVAAQAAETARVGERAAGITAQIGAEEARAKQAFESAESQWKRQLAGDVIGLGASVAGAGIQQYGQNIAGFRQAVMDESIPAGTTYSQFKGMAKEGVIKGSPELGIPEKTFGRVSPEEYARLTGASKQQIKGLKFAEYIYGSPDRVAELRASGISDADIISNAKRMQSMYVSAVGAGGDPVLIRQAMQMGGFGSQTLGSVPESDIGFDPAPELGILSEIKSGAGKGAGTDILYTPKKATEIIPQRPPDPKSSSDIKGAVKLNKWLKQYKPAEYEDKKAASKKAIKISKELRKRAEELGLPKYSTKAEIEKAEAQTLTISLGTVGGVNVPDVSIPLGKTPAQIAKILKYDKALLKQFVLFNEEYGLSDEGLKELKKIIESNETLASAG
jgi:hypothetical protein